ncbi:MAG TPA: hydroxymethylglutaryl-CoA reductase [Kiritimatiellia bacterium]|nr:hydroxymethylglutaryl-CoA reductase [Kiritimatiellia bacterium]HQG75774.1 hydroxymethylglutaryl-CoA reductase [Kiritimatiellia bacterium]HXK80314.1 hydroxymethylglutaryl-CoA reductase [Kiritimatiellia bacterium]
MKKAGATTTMATVPMQHVGPIQLAGPELSGEFMVPLATYETPLWPSVNRGARVTAQAGGIQAVIFDERMTRSVLVVAPDVVAAQNVVEFVQQSRAELAKVAAGTSRFAKLVDIHFEVVGHLVFIRFEFTTGDAAGHNMATRAADALLAWILERQPNCQYGSISGNYCCDKKPSAVNGILGRGKYTVAEVTLSARLVARYLHSTAEKIAELNTRKNLVGTALAGGLRSANAHFANMLLGFYLATGQDAANIIEGSQGFTLAEARPAGALYFSVTLPNLIVGSVGNGKELPFVQDNLRALGCLEKRPAGQNARRLALLCAATVLCGELSLLAAQTNPGELMAAHLRLERK